MQRGISNEKGNIKKTQTTQAENSIQVRPINWKEQDRPMFAIEELVEYHIIGLRMAYNKMLSQSGNCLLRDLYINRSPGEAWIQTSMCQFRVNRKAVRNG